MTIVYKTQADLTDEVLLNLIEEGTITDYNIGAVNRVIVDSINFSLSIDGAEDSLYKQLQIIDESRNIDTSTGYYLEQLGLIVGITRDDGNVSEGYVTFITNSDLDNTLTIREGDQIATSPNDPDGQKIFEVAENTTFSKNISDEIVLFTDGIYNYKLDSRFFNTINSIEAVRSGSTVVLVEDTDFSIEDYNDYVHKIDSDNPEIVFDTFDATTGWSSSDSAGISLDSSNQKEGTNCLNLGKSETSDAFFYIEKNITSVDLNGKTPSIWIYIEDISELQKLDNIRIYLGNTSITNSQQYKISRNNLSIGWNQYFLSDIESINGTFDETIIDYNRIVFNYLNKSNTTSLGNLKVDFFIGSEVEDFEGKIIKIVEAQKPDDGEDMTIDYNPRSVEVLCNSVEVGDDKNVSSDKIISKISNNSVINQIDRVNNYSSFTGATGEESDEELRTKIKAAAQAPGSASSSAIQNSLENLNYIRSVQINDRPDISITDESHVFITGKSDYRLKVQTPYLDDDVSPTNISISDTFGGTADYTYGTDYELDGEDIVWLGVSTPTNGSVFFVNYSARELCKANILISGVTSITTTQTTEINNLIDDIKPLGVKVSWSEPTEVEININTTVTLEDDYTLTDDFKNEIKTAINGYIGSLSIGDDVIVNRLISAIIQIEGISDVSISSPASNTTINSNQIATIGTITISSA